MPIEGFPRLEADLVADILSESEGVDFFLLDGSYHLLGFLFDILGHQPVQPPLVLIVPGRQFPGVFQNGAADFEIDADFEIAPVPVIDADRPLVGHGTEHHMLFIAAFPLELEHHLSIRGAASQHGQQETLRGGNLPHILFPRNNAMPATSIVSGCAFITGATGSIPSSNRSRMKLYIFASGIIALSMTECSSL